MGQVVIQVFVMYKGKEVHELLQLCCNHQCQACTQAPMPGASEKFAYSEKLPSPWSGYGRRETPDLRSAPVQGFTTSAINFLLLISSDVLTRLVCSVRKLRSGKHIVGTPDWLHNLKICMQFQDSENAQRNLEIAQIPRLHGTHTLPSNAFSLYTAATRLFS